MARHLFPPDVFWTSDTSTTPPTPRLAPAATFTVWTAREGGTDVSDDLLQTDLTTPLAPVSTADGERPWLYGPDTLDGSEVVVLYVQGGAGTRYPVYAVDAVIEALTAASDITATLVELQAKSNNDGTLTTVNPDPLIVKHATPAEWAASSLILALGQPGISYDQTTGAVELRFGDGVNPWSGLQVITGGGGGGGSGTVTVAGITDASTIGRSILQAAAAGTVRALIGIDWLAYSGTFDPEGVFTAPIGSLYRRTTGGSGTTFYMKISGTGSTGWQAIGGVATKTSVGLGNVDNTSDADKPVSTATQAQLDLRAWRVFYTGTAWPARPAGAPAYGIDWVSSQHVSAPAPTIGAGAAANGDFWLCHPDAT
jgi:hypothetical protein